MAITDYDILKILAVGGMGSIFLAMDPRLERQVAIKKIKVPENLDEQSHKEMVQRFYREARAVANISHPNIVIVHELGEDKSDNQCFMVMEFLDGKSLESLQKEMKILPISLLIKIAIQVCDALHFIHQKGIIHRDIKPSNLIYCTNGMIKITDFGLVRINDNLNLTTDGSIMGSVLFIPPEQIENPKEVDFRCDMYSFGVTLYNLLSGEFPICANDMYSVLQKLEKDEPIQLSYYNKEIPIKLEEIIMKSISKKRENRFESMDEFKKALTLFSQEQGYDYSYNMSSFNNCNTESNNIELPYKTILLPNTSNINEIEKNKNVDLLMTKMLAPKINDLPKKYIITRELGRGGMGVVYLAHDRSLDRQVAIKVLTFEIYEDNPELQDETIYTFKREALAIANLSHDNIVNVYDIGETKSGLHYIVMELLEGQPMSKLIEDGKPSVPEVALDAIVQICDSLTYIHNHKVVHRDIKPENIMLSEKGLAKLTDFGIAKFMDDKPIKSAGNLVGTVLYISPEQLQTPDSVDGRADMYSLAVSLYQLLTGKLPIDGDEVREVILKIMTEKPQPASRLNANLPRSLDEILFKALAKDKNERYRTVNDFKLALMGIAKYKNYLASKRKISESTEETKKLQRKVAEYVVTTDLNWLEEIEDKLDVEQNYFTRSMDYVIPQIVVKEISEFLDTLTIKSLDSKRIHSEDKIKQATLDFEKNTLIPIKLKSILTILSKNIPITEILHILVSIDNNIKIGQMIDNFYAKNKLRNIFNILYTFSQTEIIKFHVIQHTKGKIYIGEMLINFSFITREDLKKGLQEQPPSNLREQLGQILMKITDLENHNLLYTLRMQSWYKEILLN